MKRLAGLERLEREVVLYVMVPAANRGARADLQKHLQDPSQPINGPQYTTGFFGRIGCGDGFGRW
jgi:phosphorylase/glycogen(starch) synthase